VWWLGKSRGKSRVKSRGGSAACESLGSGSVSRRPETRDFQGWGRGEAEPEPPWKGLLDKRYAELADVLELVYEADPDEGEEAVYMALGDMEVRIASLTGHEADWTSDGKHDWDGKHYWEEEDEDDV
jgi:hypothetical protein